MEIQTTSRRDAMAMNGAERHRVLGNRETDLELGLAARQVE